MSESLIKPGTIVTSRLQPEYGPGKVLSVRDGKAYVHFRDDGDRDVRIYRVDGGPLDAADIESDRYLDNLPPFADGKFASQNHPRVTFDDALGKFLRQFPRGFADPQYLGTKTVGSSETGERNYKWRAHERYQEAFGNGEAENLLATGATQEVTKRALSVAGKDLNLLSSFESMAFRDGLMADEQAAKRYFSALFPYISTGPTKDGFEHLSEAVEALPAEEGRARVATWPVLTLLPFIARPDVFMFLKPEPTGDCADRLRFDLRYSAQLRWETYERLLDLSSMLLDRLRKHGARDFIDVQSFMWVVAKY